MLLLQNYLRRFIKTGEQNQQISGIDPNGNPRAYTAADLPLSIVAPFKVGYTFAGWTVEYANGSVVTVEDALVILEGPTGDVVLTANWVIVDIGAMDAYNETIIVFYSYYDVETWMFRRDLFAGFSVESVLKAEHIMGMAGQAHADLLAMYRRLEAGHFSKDDPVEIVVQATHIFTQAIIDMNAALRSVEGPVFFVDICDLGGVFRVWFSYPLEIENIAAT
ncbi:MAG: hypothetical protein LBQ98_08695 [Nitrososphaerota archaeon]|jgi:uncharacterized repeat protein (TIGR02543 family)|nr:hypothetical protein [Nitrososphaerota archaeon]